MHNISYVICNIKINNILFYDYNVVSIQGFILFCLLICISQNFVAHLQSKCKSFIDKVKFLFIYLLTVLILIFSAVFIS